MAEKLNLKKLAFIGGGAMGEAIIKGITGASLMDPAAVFVGAHRQERADYLHETYGVTGLVDNQEAVRDADMVVLAIKPQMVDSVLDAKLAAAVNKNAVILSIMGSVTIEKIAGIFKGHSIIRTMPNTPLAVGAGMTAIAAGEGVPEEAVRAAEQIFGCCGETVLVKEKDIISWKNYNDLTFINCACRFTEGCSLINDGTSKRLEMKELIKKLRKTNPDIDHNIFKAMDNINLNCSLGYIKGNEKHSFLDEYDK